MPNDTYFTATKNRLLRELEESDSASAARRQLAGNSRFLESGGVRCDPRPDGDSRYCYGKGGFKLWVYGSGYMHASEGPFSIVQRASEGADPNIAFFLGVPADGGAWDAVPILGVPAMIERHDGGIQRTTVFEYSSAWFFVRREWLLASLRVHADSDNNIVFTVEVSNESGKSRDCYLASCINPFICHQLFESSEYRWFREVRFHPADGDKPGLGTFLVRVNEDISRTESLMNTCHVYRSVALERGAALVRHHATTSRLSFTGSRHAGLAASESLRLGHFPEEKKVTAFTEVGVAGDIFHLNLPSGASARFDMVLETEKRIRWQDFAFRTRIISQFLIDRDMESLSRVECESHRGLRAAIGGEWPGSRLRASAFNPFFEHLKRQVRFTALHQGFVNLTDYSFIGFRDIFQAMEALAWWQKDEVRAKILEAFSFVFPDGRCPRQYSLSPSGGENRAMDLRLFVDQGNWAISTLCVYFKITGDRDLAETECGYHVIVNEGDRLVRPAELRDSVLDHLFRILGFLVSNIDPETSCLRALYGDWNDALDGLGVSSDGTEPFGSGVSVMATEHLYMNLMEMAEILEWLGRDDWRDRIAECRQLAERVAGGLRTHALETGSDGTRRIVHGWGDKKAYLVGSSRDPDGKARDGLTGNAFWVLSGLHERDAAIGEAILGAFARLDSPYGLKTFHPHFESGTPGVGRIPKLPAGTAENGASYVHATAFAIMALFRMGRPKDAWAQLEKILPLTHGFLSASTFIMSNSYCRNEELGIDGESMGDWQTGSANVVMKVLVRQVFGIDAGFRSVRVAPADGFPFDEFTCTVELRGKPLTVEYRKTGRGKRRFFDGARELEPAVDAVSGVFGVELDYRDLRPEGTTIRVEE